MTSTAALALFEDHKGKYLIATGRAGHCSVMRRVSPEPGSKTKRREYFLGDHTACRQWIARRAMAAVLRKARR